METHTKNINTINSTEDEIEYLMDIINISEGKEYEKTKKERADKLIKALTAVDEKQCPRFFSDGEYFFWILTGYSSDIPHVPVLSYNLSDPSLLMVRMNTSAVWASLEFQVNFTGFSVESRMPNGLAKNMNKIPENKFFAAMDRKYLQFKNELKNIREKIHASNLEYLQHYHPIKDMNEERDIIQNQIDAGTIPDTPAFRSRIRSYIANLEYERMNGGDNARRNAILRCGNTYYYPLGNKIYQDYLAFALDEPIFPLPYFSEDLIWAFAYYFPDFHFVKAGPLPSNLISEEDRREKVEEISEDEYFSKLDSHYSQMKKELREFSENIRGMIEKIGEGEE